MVWILISVFILILLFGVLFVLFNKEKKAEPDYYTLFVVGICWVGAGSALATTTKNYGLFVIGLIFMIAGILNKDKWKKHKSWKEMGDKEKRKKMFILIVLGILLLVGLVAFFLVAKV